jgi:hypothetical protein
MAKSALISKILGTLMGITSMGVILACCSGIGIGIGTSANPNDVRPTSQVMVQGSFTGLNGKTVTGNAMVFDTGNLNYVLRLEGISTPAEGGLQVRLFGSDRQHNFDLRAYSGSQNYSFTSTNTSVRFTDVSIFSTVTNMPYGSALLSGTD